MMPEDENVLDAEQWKVEAQAIMYDVKDHVKNLQVSQTIPSSNKAIHLDLTILEGLQFCVRLSSEGFCIIGNKHVCTDFADSNLEYYETIYSLLNHISPLYRVSFSNSLLEKLKQISDGD